MSDLSPEEREKVREAVHERWQEISVDHLTDRQTEQRRLAAEMRSVIDKLVATQAPEEALRYAADALARLAVEFDIYPRGRTYEGFAEAANAGGDLAALFDHSPLIGKANPLAPPMLLETGDDRVFGRVTFGSAYEGPPGCVHGGYVAAMFDELLGAGQSLSGCAGMTGTLSIRYRRPTPLHRELDLETWVDRVEGRKIFVRGTCAVDGVTVSEAEGIFISLPAERFVELRDERDRRLADGPVPEA
jgi:acyl-coenzyme A thioesterase PaaI-like protein